MAPCRTSTYTATVFKAKCLGILDRLAVRRLTRVTITKRGKVVAVLTPPDDLRLPFAKCMDFYAAWWSRRPISISRRPCWARLT